MVFALCIGGGPAGLTAAYQLVRHRHDILVLEADPDYVGGISRTVEKDGFHFDIGGHRFFSKSEEVIALWKEILGEGLLVRGRKSRIYYGGKFYPYPLNLQKTLRNLGLVQSALCTLSYLRARITPSPVPRTFEQWVSKQFGRRLFLIFFKTYTEKVWGMPCSEISADWAAQRIKNLSFAMALKNAFYGMLGLNRNRAGVKTLIESFLYPRRGPGMMWERAAQKIVEAGGAVRRGSVVTSLAYDAQEKRWHVGGRNKDGSALAVRAEHVVSTMPLRELVAAIKESPEDVRHAAQQLRYRDFLTVALVLPDRGAFDDNWIYIHDPKVKVGRIQNFKVWSPDMVPDDTHACYGFEYFCFEGDGLWNSSDDALVALAARELEAIGLGRATDVIRGYVVRQPKAYPVYDDAYQHHVSVIRQWLERECPNLQVVGRNGMHKYNNQDHSMMTALLAAENILRGERRFDVWKINDDAQYHEEGSGASGERLVPSAIKP